MSNTEVIGSQNSRDRVEEAIPLREIRSKDDAIPATATCEDLDQREMKGEYKCNGKDCLRFYQRVHNEYCFKSINNSALAPVSFKSPVAPSSADKTFCEVCLPSALRNVVSGVRVADDCLRHDEAKCGGCWQKWFESTDECDNERIRRRAYNPIWTGDDPTQIGIFIRNLRIQALNIETQTLMLSFYLGIVWLDPEFCDYVKNHQTSQEEDCDLNLTPKDYEYYCNRWEKGKKDKKHLPRVRIWNYDGSAFHTRESSFTLSDPTIGHGTVFWERLLQVNILNDFESRTFPFGYEMFELKIRLFEAKQHLVLFRSKRWHDQHAKQCGEFLAGHSYSYINPHNVRLPDWKICSIHNNEDRWYSKFDNNDLLYSLPVRVSHGIGTQSEFIGLIVMKRRPQFIFWNIWITFTITTLVSLLTYQLDPSDELSERLKIAVAVFLAQMTQKWVSSYKTPEVTYLTCLDLHICLSMFLVLAEPSLQGLLVAIDNRNKNFDLEEADTWLAYINFALVVLANLFTLGFAKYRQRQQRLNIEEKARSWTGFDREPLQRAYSTDLQGAWKEGEQIGNRVRVSGWKDGQPFHITEEARLKRIRNFENFGKQTKVRNTPGFLTCCGCCIQSTINYV